jgi:hypothetical protein
MTVENVVVFVEEPSMEAALRALLPRMLGGLTFEIHSFQCKERLLANLPARLRGYAGWIPKNWRIVVLVDRDDDACVELKKRIETIAAHARLTTRSRSNAKSYVVINRLAIEELEAWYFGDWKAVRAAFPRAPATIPRKARYRKPDEITGGTWEAFERVLQQAGYFRGGLRKIEAAREVAQHMEPSRNTSPSFRALREVLAEISTA